MTGLKVELLILPLLCAARAAYFYDGREAMKQHNIYRCMHNAPLLVYSNDLAEDAQDYADTLALSCGELEYDHDNTDGENLASCTTADVTVEMCDSGYFATQTWYEEGQYYIPGATRTSNSPGKDAGRFTQVLWKGSEELGCAISHCTLGRTGDAWFRTYVVCRYSPAGNVEGHYQENVDEHVAFTQDFCTDYVNALNEPRMVGFQNQKFDFTGVDGEWYALLHDHLLDMDMNIRITQPVATVPEVTYITGLGLSVLGADDEMHTIEIVINDPHNVEPGCPHGSSRPCLADGAFTILVDNKEAGVGELELGSGVHLSALNLPGECRPSGHQMYRLPKEAKVDINAGRRLRSGRRKRTTVSPEVWVMKDRYRTDPEECDKYIQEASVAGTLFEHESEHASLQITVPSVSLRVNIGKLHGGTVRHPTDSLDLPDHAGYRINLVFESIDGISLNAQGILGETIQLRFDEDGNPITLGPDCIREEESYKVTGSLAKGFTLKLQEKEMLSSKIMLSV